MIKVNISGEEYSFTVGITLNEILKNINKYDRDIIVGAIVNNQLSDLSESISKKSTIKFLTINDEIGNRIYRRSLFMVMTKAVYELFPESKLNIEHSLSNGIYCELYKEKPLNYNDLKKIKRKMYEYVKKDLPINKVLLKKEELKEKLNEQGYNEKIDILEFIKDNTIPVYELEGTYDYFFYNMVPKTGMLDRFDLHYRMPGFILLYPQRGNPHNIPQFKEQPKLADVFYEYERWGEVIGVANVRDLNKMIKENKYQDLIRVNEAFHEKKIARIADQITKNIEKNRIILIAGPSSSGKTTFAQRLAIQLRVNGVKPIAISTDNYFVNREDTPLDDEGNYDYESIEAIDLNLFNEQILSLLQGEKINMPTFNFHEGKRKYNNQYLQIQGEQPIIIEGIHSLNDRLTSVIPQNNKFKIYVSALTQINIDRHNRIPTTDARLIRRIVRDHYFRNRSAAITLDWWPGVRRGEEINIFPFQENADVMFNTALIYEFSVLKKYASPLLENIKPEENCYYQAQRLLDLLECFLVIDEDDIPRVSILKEFIGDSAFSS
ncbi:MAG: nucleoside kinase [bacterium]